MSSKAKDSPIIFLNWSQLILTEVQEFSMVISHITALVEKHYLIKVMFYTETHYTKHCPRDFVIVDHKCGFIKSRV